LKKSNLQRSTSADPGEPSAASLPAELSRELDEPAGQPITAARVQIPRTLSDEQIERMGKSFLGWYLSRRELHSPEILFSDVLLWAKNVGIELTSSAFDALEKILRFSRKKLAEGLSEPFVQLSRESESGLAELMLKEVAAAFDAHEREKTLELLQPSATLHSLAPEKSLERDRDTVRAIVNTLPLTPDGAQAKELSWKLTTNNIPSEEIDDVIRYLAELQELLRRQSASLRAGSGDPLHGDQQCPPRSLEIIRTFSYL